MCVFVYLFVCLCVLSYMCVYIVLPIGICITISYRSNAPSYYYYYYFYYQIYVFYTIVFMEKVYHNCMKIYKIYDYYKYNIIFILSNKALHNSTLKSLVLLS